MGDVSEGSALTTALERVRVEGTYTAYMAAANALAALRRQSDESAFRIGVLRNYTVEPLLPIMEVELAREGIMTRTYVGDFDAVAADALNPESRLAQFDPQAVILALWLEGLSPSLVGRFPSLEPDEVVGETHRLLTYVREMIEGIRRFSQAPILLNNFPLPARPALGILDAQSEDSQAESFLSLNRGVRVIAKEVGNVFIVDYMSLIASVGMAEAFDERNWVHRGSPMGPRALVPIGREYAKFFLALRGKARKCIVVDCDNTLWGGIIGEDGMQGIQLGEGHPGSTYTALQRELLNLHDRGVLIALCSKNNEADVFEVLRSHSGMLINEAHIAAHRVNWEDKAANIRAIANELNIGLDSLVFVDDSVFECDLVRQQLPEVAVVELRKDFGSLASQLARYGYFDSLGASKEDRLRTAHFKAETGRRELRSSASSLEEYLERLAMVAEIGPATDEVVPRIAQLTQKTNQFNLTTRRYTETDIRRFMEADSKEVLYLRLRDNVADLGIVGVAILQVSDGIAEIDSFLISCRALGRGVESVLLEELRLRAEERGCTRMRGVYIPTAKNPQVATFYQSAGFAPESGLQHSFIAGVQDIPRPEKPITVIRARVPQPQA
ncbi:MAG: HAD-IIIC family phosphatase [Gemmatimonadota bacterium]|nr:HAD-IIIC family phosphatase [Gemmatimonadota bacterium]